MVTFEELFKYLQTKCNFHGEKPEDITWTCFGDLRFTRTFCEANVLEFESVKERLNGTGGYCDCEVLFNSTVHLRGEI